MTPRAPSTIRLRPGALVRARRITRLLRAHAASRSQAVRWRSSFRFRNDERTFAVRLLRRKPNLWLFRCHQQRFCGDFVVVDMSCPDPARRSVWAIELKRGAPLRVGGGAGVQLARAGAAIAEVGRRTGVVAGGGAFERLTGDAEAILHHLTLRRCDRLDSGEVGWRGRSARLRRPTALRTRCRSRRRC